MKDNALSFMSEIVCRGDNENVLDEVDREVHKLEDGQGQVVDEHDVCQQGLHRGGDDLNYSQGEGDRQHQRGGAQEVRDQAGDVPATDRRQLAVGGQYDHGKIVGG